MSDDATVKFGYDGKALNAGLNAQEKLLLNHAKTTESAFSRMSSSVGSSFGSMIPAVGVGVLVAGFKSITNEMDDLLDTSLRLGESAEMIQKVEYASKLLASVDADGLTKSFLRLEKSLADVENKAANEALENLGITADKLARMPLDEKILALSEAFQKARESGTGFKDISDLIGKSAGDLIPMLVQTRETIQGMFDQAHIVPDSEVQRLADLNDELDGFVARTKGLTTEAAGVVVSNMQSMWRTMNDLLGGKSMEESVDLDRARKQEAMGKRESDRLEREKKRGQAADALAAEAKEKQNAVIAKKSEEQNKRIESAQKRLNETRQKAAEEEMTTAERIADVKQRLEAPVDATKDKEQQIQAEEEKIQLQMVLNRLLKEQTSETKRAADEADAAARKQHDHEKQALKDHEDKLRRQKELNTSRNDGMRSLEELRLRARGNDKGADKLVKQKRIEDITKYYREMGASEEFARQKAEETLRLEDKIEARRSGKASHIGGVTKKTMMTSGIDQFNRNQEKEYETTDPARPGYQRGRPRPMHDAFSRGEPTSAQRTGRYMGGEKAGTRDYSQTETYKTAQSKNEAANSGSGGVASKIDKSNEHLSTIAAALA